MRQTNTFNLFFLRLGIIVKCKEQIAVETVFSESTGGAVVMALTTRPHVVMVSRFVLILPSAGVF